MKKCLRLVALVVLCLFVTAAALAAATTGPQKNQPQVMHRPDLTLAKANIKVTVPKKDQVLDLRWGYTKKIEWEYSGLTHGKTLDNTTVKINLYKNGAFSRTIADNVPIGADNKGSYSWTITPDIIWSKDYQIEIISLADQTVKTMSEIFAILYIVT